MPNLPTVSLVIPPSARPLSAVETDPLRDAAKQLEASFLTEMLKSAGFGKSREGLGGGGTGEEQFSSFLIRAQAEKITEAGGIGLAESLYNSLKDAQND